MKPIPPHRRLLGENIASVRRAEGLTETRLAELAGFDEAYIRRLEAGKENVPFDTLVRIAKALNISVSDLTAAI